MCFGRSTSFSRNTESSPKAFRASEPARSSSSGSSSALRTTRMPRPPPPADALIITGKPTLSVKARAASSVRTGSAVPGTIGTPADAAILRAATLSPSASIASGDGPMNTMPASRHLRAKEARSERRP